MTKNDVCAEGGESDHEDYMKSLKSIFLIDKLADDSQTQNLITFYKYYNFKNSFVPKIIQFEKFLIDPRR